jgi:hypothetical protein
MSQAPVRVPLEPYPGLRPFLDFEAALLFGRERQVREVIERLRDTQFVAVLGGSGSGKSSLIHAGVTPQLRSFGIPGAGDFWITMTCTPGTNVAQTEGGQPQHTPITRLAWKFSALLRSRGSAEKDAARLTEIAEIFRQEAGFARLLETYADELAVPPGPDPQEARLLFVIDQFEELFHPTNKGVDDGRLMVERVIDHFFNPHARAFVVLTMRSEHLNDCAGFLELPDAINRSSYLVRRLDEDELRDAIVQPAQRYLRLCARSSEGVALPEEVRFEPALLERLLHDVSAITHDPDHLPLLQHLLARLWHAARAREGGGLPVPAHITLDDLAVAVSGGGPAAPLDERQNSLRASLENWAEASYQRHAKAQRLQLDALLRKLAFKDPNTGMYTQQRVNVDDSAALIGSGQTRNDLKALIADGFVGSVDYLFWDDEDPSRVTLKVSHESFIRGWSHFRLLIDAESERFEEFVGALGKCAAWCAHGRSDELLLEASDLRRLADIDLHAMMGPSAERATWFRFLQIDRDGPRLARLEPEFDAYLRASAQRQRDLEASAKRSRFGWRATSVLTLLLLPYALFVVLIQVPVTDRALLLFEAGNLANSTAQTLTYTEAQAGRDALKTLDKAASLVEQARSGEGSLLARLSQPLLRHFGFISAVKRQAALLDELTSLVEPNVNGRLRETLSSWLWPTTAPPPGSEIVSAPVQRKFCDVGARDFDTSQPNGLLFTSSDGSLGARRFLFVPDAGRSGDDAIALRVATFDDTGSVCTATQTVLAIPQFLQPRIVVDATLRYFMFTQGGQSVDVPSLTVHEIAWERTPEGRSRMAARQQRAVVLDSAAIRAVEGAAGNAAAAVVPTFRVAAGRVLKIGAGYWQMVSASAQLLDGGPDPALVPLKVADPDSPCGVLGALRPAQPGFELTAYADNKRCTTVTMRRAGGDPTREVLVAVYAEPDGGTVDELRDRLRQRPPVAIATMNQFTRLLKEPSAWLVARSGDHQGWLVYRTRTAANDEVDAGAPWSTCALAVVGARLAGTAPPRCAAARAATVAP